jgi:hypothetical protein
LAGCKSNFILPKGFLSPWLQVTVPLYNDDALSLVGRVTAVQLNEDGSASFEADIANTTQGRDVAMLVSGDNPFLKSISIRGEWLADVETVEHQGQKVTTSKDFRVSGIDFTSRPGISGATIEDVEMVNESESFDSSMIFESCEDFEIEEDPDEFVFEADGFVPPAGVRAKAKKALKWIEDGEAGGGFTDVGRKRAADLAAGRAVSRETIGRISQLSWSPPRRQEGRGVESGREGLPEPRSRGLGCVGWRSCHCLDSQDFECE